MSDFFVSLVKGLLDDDRWSWDLDTLSDEDWKAYQQSILDPTHIRTTLAVFINNIRLDADNKVLNYVDARFRAFQYFRAYVSIGGYTWESVALPFQPWELEEPD